MSGSRLDGAGRTPSSQLQWPLAGVAVLLIVLILLTPNLFSTSAGGLQTQAQLIVDRSTVSNATSFYVESIGTATRYQSIQVGFASVPSWPYHGSVTHLGPWNWTRATQTLVVTVVNASNPVAVNITVVYTTPSGTATQYVGVYAFYLNTTSATLNAMTLLAGASPPPASTPVVDLPIFLLLPTKISAGS